MSPTMQEQQRNGQVSRQASSMVARESITGESPEVEALAQWLSECISSGRLVALSLASRTAVDASLSAICSWDEEDFDKYQTPQDLAPVIMAAAVHDADSQRGTTRYVVNAYRSGEKAHFRKYSFRLDGGQTFTDKDEANYPPTEQGVLAMAMKHAEFAIRSFSAAQAESLRMLSSQVNELHRQNNKLAGQQYKVLELQQQMLDRQAERDLAVRDQDAKEKRKQMMFEKFLVLWPIIAKKFFGGKEDKGSNTILAEEQLGTLLESMDEEQVRQLVPILSEEQKIGFFTVYQEYKSRKKRLAEPGHGESQGGVMGAAPEPEPQPEAQPEPEPEAAPAEDVEASAQDMGYEAEVAAAEVVAAEVVAEAPVDAEATVEAAPAWHEGVTIPAPTGAVVASSPEPEPDRTFELMVEVLGDDMNDEKIGRLAERLDTGKRTLFLAAVAAKRAAIESAPIVEASVTSSAQDVSPDGGVGSADGSS
jgi:hypothetical protein